MSENKTLKPLAIALLLGVVPLTMSSAMATTSVGPTGPAGPAGPRGATGPAGPQGPAGVKGEKGDKGDKGASGTIGATGAKGATGPVGATGAPGPAGSVFNYSMTCGIAGTEACKVGAVGPGGGWIFFVDYNDEYPGFDYLEAAPADIPALAWCSDTINSITAVDGWSANAVGTGQANTTAMLGVCSTGAANSAAAYSTPTTQAGDWFLGSEGEMMLMYTNLRQKGVGGFASNYYWSSSELDSNYAWLQSFYTGGQNYYNKYAIVVARAVRAF